MFHHRPSHAGEVKSEAAEHAAQDPGNKTTADDAENVMLNEAKNAGGQAFVFNPDASPEEKAAQARTVCFTRDSYLDFD